MYVALPVYTEGGNKEASLTYHISAKVFYCTEVGSTLNSDCCSGPLPHSILFWWPGNDISD